MRPRLSCRRPAQAARRGYGFIFEAISLASKRPIARVRQNVALCPPGGKGCCGDYREIEGCHVPTRAAVSWLLDDGPFEYWRGKVTAYDMK
jgi:hypothetical protein